MNVRRMPTRVHGHSGDGKPHPWVVKLRFWQHRKGWVEGRGCPTGLLAQTFPCPGTEA